MFANERMSVDFGVSNSYRRTVINLRENLRFLPPDTDMKIPVEEAVRNKQF